MPGLVGAVVLAGMSGVSAVDTVADTAIREFMQRVHSYIQLRHHLVKRLPRVRSSSDWRAIDAAANALGQAIQTARAEATVGDIFTATVSGAFRRRIVDALSEGSYDTADLLLDLAREAPITPPSLAVNARFDWAFGALMPGRIIVALPPLPAELQYRFVGRDLVLLDVDTGLVVDVLRQALTSTDVDTGGDRGQLVPAL
jgi:hypothetical protein